MDNKCSKRRPDFLIPINYGSIVVEVDEYQHNRKNYPCECEITRMKQIYFDIGAKHLISIRYNPDKYKPSYGSEWTLQQRETKLIKLIKELITKHPTNSLEVYYLFYDGFTELEDHIDIINPYNE